MRKKKVWALFALLLWLSSGCGGGRGSETTRHGIFPRSPSLPAPAPRADGTGVGNGGDLLDRFLSATHLALRETVAGMAADPGSRAWCECPEARNPHDLDCRYLRSLTPAERRYCTRALTRSLARLTDLLDEKLGIRVRLSPDALYVQTRAGKRQAIARTVPGSHEILFSAPQLNHLSPASVMTVLGHELAHHLPLGPRGYPDDDDTIAGFGRARRLLDAFGAALTLEAARSGRVGRFAGARDLFACAIRERGRELSFEPSGQSERLYLNYDWLAYTSGIGARPRDFRCELQESSGRISLVAHIDEPGGCRRGLPGRSTRLELWRTRGGVTEKIAERRWPGVNPICGAPRELLALPYREGTRQYEISLRYLETLVDQYRALTAPD